MAGSRSVTGLTAKSGVLPAVAEGATVTACDRVKLVLDSEDPGGDPAGKRPPLKSRSQTPEPEARRLPARDSRP